VVAISEIDPRPAAGATPQKNLAILAVWRFRNPSHALPKKICVPLRNLRTAETAADAPVWAKRNLECGDKSRAVRGSRHRFPEPARAKAASRGIPLAAALQIRLISLISPIMPLACCLLPG